MSKSAGYATNNICTRVSCADAHLHHGACSCLVLSSATYSVFFAPEYVEDGGQYEVPEDVLHPVCHAGVPAWAQEASGPSIDPTRRLWGEEPSSDPAADSYANYTSEQEDEEPREPQIGDDVRDRCLPCPCLSVLQNMHF